MPIVKTLLETWQCDTCGRSAVHVHGTGAILADEFFVAQLKWHRVDRDTVRCDRCTTPPTTVIPSH